MVWTIGRCEGRSSTTIVWSVHEVLLSWLRERLLRGVHCLLLLNTGRAHGGKE
jgi:hypothetical protein